MDETLRHVICFQKVTVKLITLHADPAEEYRAGMVKRSIILIRTQ